MRATDRLRPIELAEVDQVAALQTRLDRTYLVPEPVADRLVAEAAGHARVLVVAGRRDLAYESVYFDTPDLAAYRAAASGRRRRFKVRTRTYLDTGTTMLEVKTRSGRGETIKARMPHDAAATELDRVGVAFVEEQLADLAPATALVPVLTTRYRRTTVVDLQVPMRMTVDTGLVCAQDGASVRLPDLAVVEVKSAGWTTPADRWLWRHGYRPQPVSKYALGVAALRGLPGNRWRRPLSLVG